MTKEGRFMSENKTTDRLQSKQRIVQLISRSELLRGSLERQFTHTELCLRHCNHDEKAVVGYALLLIDVASVSPEESLRLLRRTDEQPVALLNATPPIALQLMEQHPWINGVFYRGTARATFQSGIDAILAGGDWLPRPLMEKLVARYRQMARCNELISQLSTREKQILKLAGQGLSNVDIANQIYLSIHTVKSHVHNALQKLGATNRAQAAAMVLGYQGESNS
jgi:LuxR family transcriptional regulator, positive regulator of biofilm formation